MNSVQKEASGSWDTLRRYTSARVALGHTGGSLRTVQRLQFSLDHAKAKDAVEYQLDWTNIAGEFASLVPETLLLSTKADHRSLYLQRPDLGKQLEQDSVETL
jgi:ethanolamine ammonia-lyase small subunit